MSTHTTQNFEVHQGSDKTLNFTVTDESGDAVDITGATIKWILATDQGASASLTKTGSVTSGTSGKFSVSLTGADTDGFSGMFYHEARVTDGSGTITHVVSGLVNIIGTVTKDTD